MGDARRRRAILGDEAYFAGSAAWQKQRPTSLPTADAWMTMHTAMCQAMQKSTVVTADGKSVSLSGFDDQSHSTLDTRRGRSRAFGTTRTITCRACGARARVQP